MIYILIAILMLGIIAATSGALRYYRLRKEIKKRKIIALPEIKNPDPSCCGAHEICEKESLLAAVSKEIEYYDDEELDVFRNRPSDRYTDEETAQFSEIFYTLAPADVAGWVRSLQLREISLPDALKDEVMLIIRERRFPPSLKKKASS